MHIGATIITHWKNFDFYTRDVLNYAPRTLQPDMVSLWPPTELAEGYQYETGDGELRVERRDAEHEHLLRPSARHVEGMLMAYLPKEKILIEADLFDTSPAATHATEANQSLYHEVQTLKLDVATIVPIHGQPAPWTDFLKVVGRRATKH